MTGWFRYVIVGTKFVQAAAADFPIWSHGARNGGRMKTAAIIAEYNPFHNGHAYHIEETRRQTGADFIIAAMSGDYVQRGAPALIDKYARTKMALAGGADLIIELPCSVSLASAEGFASGAVSLLTALSCVDELSFGSECGDIERLSLAASLLASESDTFRQELRTHMKEGMTFPAARQLAFAAAHPEYRELAELLATPNNILGIEYCLALRSLHSPIRPWTITRKGSGYHDRTLLDTDEASLKEASSGTGYPSAGAIRAALTAHLPASGHSDNPELMDILQYGIPPACHSVLREALADGILTQDDYTPYLYYRLVYSDNTFLSSFPDVTPELANRIRILGRHIQSYSEFAKALKPRQYTRSRIDRILMRLILDIRRTDTAASYARILGFKKTAAPLLKAIRQNSRIPVITRPAPDERKLTAEALAGFRADLRASELARHIREASLGRHIRNEYTRGLILDPE